MKRLGKIQTFAIAAVAGLALATPFAIAQTGGGDAQGKDHGKRGEWGGRRGGGGDHRGGGRFGGGMFRGIDLTEEQKTRLQQIHQSFGESTRALREQLRAKHDEVRQAGEGNTFNEQLAAQKLTEAAALQAKLMGEEFRMRQESLSVLTAEQKAQMEQKREERRNRRGERRGERRGGGQIL
ncbi:MAG TPA: Spy/CpxP family protein refolding chaperone [Pyrinomonadaceae bacterium]